MEENEKKSARHTKRSLASEDVEARLIRIARELMFAHGYENVTTDMLAREANVSKATIYRNFSSKADLMGRMVNAESETIFDGIPDRVDTSSAFRDALQSYGERFLELILSPEKMTFERTLLSKADELPQGARLFFTNAHIGTRDRLAKFISNAQTNDKARSDLPASRLAEHLLMLWKGLDHCALQLGLPIDDQADRKAHVSECIDLVFPAK
ncbi:MAG: TetR/AcrR family transcriptional regulator [Erythrobacter sp.]